MIPWHRGISVLFGKLPGTQVEKKKAAHNDVILTTQEAGTTFLFNGNRWEDVNLGTFGKVWKHLRNMLEGYNLFNGNMLQSF
jgi:hypothetical protein